MKKTIVLTLAIMITFASLGRQKAATVKAPVIPRVTAKQVKQMIDTSTGPMIINFWATWCGPCIREIPWFERVIAQSAAPVKLVLVSLDFPEAYSKTLPAFVKQQGYKATVLYLNETNADSFIPAIDKKWEGAIPASIFVNNSKQYYRLFNQQIPEKAFELELKKLL